VLPVRRHPLVAGPRRCAGLAAARSTLQPLTQRLPREVGAVATEYVLLLVAVALVIVTAVVAFGGVLADRYDESADCVATVSVDSPACP